MHCNFESRKVYLEWCEEKVQALVTGQIAMNGKMIRDVLAEINMRLHVCEGDDLYGDNPED